MANPKITKLELVIYEHKIQDLGRDYNGFNLVYEKGSVLTTRPSVLRVHTDAGIVGEYPGGGSADRIGSVAGYLLGKNPFEREKIYNDLKRGLRHTDRTAICPVDVALWDFAGKAFNAPIYRLLGGYRQALPAYASTYHGDENGGLSTPEAFAAFALQCKEMGYPAFKIHGWGNGPIARECETVLETRRQVGSGMDLMIDPACE